MKNKTMAIAGLILISLLAVKASPRTSYLSSKVQEAYAIEIQAKAKFRASEERYRASKAYTRSLRKELKDVMKREAREDKAIRAAARAEYGHVNAYGLDDTSYPVAARVVR